ncbi:lysozyme [Limnobaculum xujianqingii]|uniref:lysozyme n=1 Tax=Limnobaculum xujianqingii TaxID=2738837 RepID=UPI00112B51C8|nr:lysozyme [Limnobaculum xujianqingii]
MVTSQNGIDLIKRFEGLVLTAYSDPATGGEPWTIGYGHIEDVKPGDKISEQEAEEFLKDDLKQFESEVSSLVNVSINQNQFDALVSFAFNLGSNALKGSTLLKRLNEGNFRAAAGQFTRWVYANNKFMKGLYNRRRAERDLFIS